jgi:hypothetical protein
MKNRLKKLGFKKIKNTGPGFHMWELDFKDVKIIHTDLSKMKVNDAKKNKA